MTSIPPREKSRSLAVLAAGLVPVLLVTALVYVLAGALGGEPVYDDLEIIRRNPLVADLANLPQLLTRPYWDFLAPGDAEQIGYWRPLTGVAHAVSYWIASGETWAFHAMGLAVHLGATAAAFFLARRLSGNVGVGTFTALVFGLHPVHVESVAWISALNDPLFGLFALLSLVAYLRWRDRGSSGIPLAAAVCFLLALLSKELGAAVVLLVAVIDLGRRRLADEPEGPFSGFHSLVRAYVPFGIVLALYLVARMFVFESPLAGFDRETTGFEVGLLRLATLRVELLGGALELLAVPYHLRLFRPFRPEFTLFSYYGIRMFGWAIAAILLGVFLWRRGARLGLLALLILPAGLLPVLISVKSLGMFPLSDRFLYLPVFGLGFGMCLLLFRYLPGVVAGFFVTVPCIAYGIKSVERIRTWQNEDALFTTAVEESPRCPGALWGRGRTMLGRLIEHPDPQLLREAMKIYEDAGDLLAGAKPGEDLWASSRDFLQVNLGLGWCYLLEAEMYGDESYETAIWIFEEQARRVEADLEGARKREALGIPVRTEHLELEQVYTGLGVAYYRSGDRARGEEEIRKALAFKRDYAPAHSMLGDIFRDQGQHQAARRCYEKALSQRPDNYLDQLRIAQSFCAEGRMREGVKLAHELVERFPDEPDAMVVIAADALGKRDWREALRWLDRALGVDPQHGYAWYHKGNALVLRDLQSAGSAAGRGEETLEAFRNAARLMPTAYEVQYQFAAYLLMAGAHEAAMPHLARVYGLCEDEDGLLQLHQTLTTIPDPTPDWLCSLAGIDRSREALDMAESWLTTSLAIDPEHADSLILLGRILRERGRDEEALGCLRRACGSDEHAFEVHSELGLYLRELGRTEQAIEELETALRIGPPATWDTKLAEAAIARLEGKLVELRGIRDTVGPPMDGG